MVSQVICVHDVSSIYRVPLLLEDQGVVGYFARRLDMPIETRPRKMLTKWKEMSDRWVDADQPPGLYVFAIFLFV